MGRGSHGLRRGHYSWVATRLVHLVVLFGCVQLLVRILVLLRVWTQLLIRAGRVKVSGACPDCCDICGVDDALH